MAAAQGLSAALEDARKMLWQHPCRSRAPQQPRAAARQRAAPFAALPAAGSGAPLPLRKGAATRSRGLADDTDGEEEQQSSRRGRGAGYYRRYLANRRARGGEFLEPLSPGAPPLPPTAWLPQLSDEPLPRGAGALAHGNAAGGVVGGPSPWPGNGEWLRSVVCEAVEAARLMAPPEVVRPRDAPDRMRDRIPEAEAAAYLARLRPGEGVVVGPPDAALTGPASAAGLVPLPRLPGADAAAARGDPVVVHVLWDLASVHPRALDPRAVAAQLGRTLGAYGEVTTAAVYAPRRLLAWVPEALMRRYAPERLPAFRTAARGGGGGGSGSGDSGGGGAEVRLMCPVCGRACRSYPLLQRHMRAVHDRKAPPQDDVQRLDAREVEAGSGSGAGKKRREGGTNDLPPTAAAALAAAWDGSLTNARDRTLGRVVAYTSAGGVLFAPRGGTQVTLKYCLAREGWEARLVQNEREAVDESVATGVEALLRELEEAAEEAAAHTVVAVVSDSRTHAALLARARQLGCSTVVVCDRRTDYPEADALLRWRLLSAGRYSTGGGGDMAQAD